MRKVIVFAIAVAACSPAFAQSYGIDTYWNTSGPKPIPCLYNGQEFYAADEICVRPGFKQICQLDGSLLASASDTDCKDPPQRSVSYSRRDAGTEVLCDVDGAKYSVGADICTAKGMKETCEASGLLSNAVPDASCTAQAN
jgi:hypothetical protein